MMKTFLSAAAIMLAAASSAHALTWSASGDFSTTNNPNGPWSYGILTDPSDILTFSTLPSGSSGNLEGWNGTDGGNFPTIWKNTGSGDATVSEAIVGSGDLYLHPGQSTGPHVTVRWTAPSSGTFDIDGAFATLDATGPAITTTDVSVRRNGVAAAAGSLTGSALTEEVAFDLSLALTAGDILDFTVSPGSTFFGDSTGFDATITEDKSLGVIPLPAALPLLLPLLLGWLGASRVVRRRV